MSGWGGKREGAGRPPGARQSHSKNMVLEARRAVAEARAQGRKLAKEVADDFMHIFAALALEVRPVTERERKRGVAANPKADEAKFKQLSAILLSWVQTLIPYQSARFQQVKFDLGELADGGPDAEDAGAMEMLERLLDAYAEADEEERRRRVEDRRFMDARPVAGQEVAPEPAQPAASDNVVAPPDNVVPLQVPARPKTTTELFFETYGRPPGSGQRDQ